LRERRLRARLLMVCSKLSEWVGVGGPRPRDDDHRPTARGPERPAAELYPTHGKETVGFRTRYGSKFHFLAKIVPADRLISPTGPPLCDAESATPRPAAPTTPSGPRDPRGATERNRIEGNHQDVRGHALQDSHPDLDLHPAEWRSGIAVGLERLTRWRPSCSTTCLPPTPPDDLREKNPMKTMTLTTAGPVSQWGWSG